MEKIDYLPLGSVVYLEEGTKKVLIVARGLKVRNGDSEVFFDYGGVEYPIGVAGDMMAYFQHDTIVETVFEGYRDDENEKATEAINNFLEENPDIVRGSVENWVGVTAEE